MNYPTHKTRTGFTLVEILVVIVIATVVLSIAIPRIRTINKERSTREAARIVGSAFANAGQRARIDGVAGVRLTRNANFLQGTFQFAAAEVSLLRSVPNYVGDTEGAMIQNDVPAATPNNLISILMPLEQDELNIVRAGDLISFNGSSVTYRILAVNEDTDESGNPAIGTMQLQLDLAGYLPGPAHESSFSISRRPRVLRSSTSTLPSNQIIDLRFSGFEVLDGQLPSRLTSVFEPIIGGVENNFDIDFIFDEEGAVDRIYYNNPAATFRTPLGPLYFFVTEAPNSVETSEPVATQDNTSLWVSISSLSSSTNIGYNNSAPSAGQTYVSMTDLYENDRDQLNTIINNSRDNTLSSSANQ